MPIILLISKNIEIAVIAPDSKKVDLIAFLTKIKSFIVPEYRNYRQAVTITGKAEETGFTVGKMLSESFEVDT